MPSNTLNMSAQELNNKAWESRYSDRSEALAFAHEAKTSAAKQNNLTDFHFACLTIAQLLFWKSSDGEQLKVAKEALSYFETKNELSGISRAHYICAGIYEQFGQYERGMHHALSAVKTSELLEDETNKADCYTLLGQIYSRIHDYENAIHALKKGLEIRKKLNEEKAIASSLNLIARNYLLSKNYEAAKTYYEESLLLRETIGDKEGIPWTYLGIASLYSEKKEWDHAFNFFNKAEQSNHSNEQRFELLCLLGKGKTYLKQASTAKAIFCLNKALTIAKDLKIISLESETNQLLAEAYEKEGDLVHALTHYKSYDELRQEILSSEKVNMLKQQQIAFSVEHAEKEAEIHRLKNVELKNAFDKIAEQHYELEEKNKEITDSINYAKRIQDAILPDPTLLSDFFPNAFILFKPKDIVSGDFYWFGEKDGKKIIIAADCTGHGVPGSLMSMIGSNILHQLISEKSITRPDYILNKLHQKIRIALKQTDEKAETRDGMDIAVVSIENNILQYAGAQRPLWIVKNNKLEEIKANKFSIGGIQQEEERVFTNHILTLEKNDCIYLFSDGYVDQFGGEKGKKFMTKKFNQLLVDIHEKTISEQKEIVNLTLENWKSDTEQVDDILVIGIKI